MALAADTTGDLTMGSWVIPGLFHPFLPDAVAHWLESVHEHRVVIAAVHLVIGWALIAGAALYVVLVVKRHAGDPRPKGGTATTLFFDWIGGLVPPIRKDRLKFRDTLVPPYYEAALVIAIAIASAALLLVPVEPIHHLGRAIHRANAFYATVVIIQALLVIVSKLIPERYPETTLVPVSPPPEGRDPR
ncbi:MAG: hypothetical protein WDA16_13435 [Candidatus Thermoplasmatota archaeon]